MGRRWGRTYRLGERVTARLLEAAPLTGGLILELVEAPEAARGAEAAGTSEAAARHESGASNRRKHRPGRRRRAPKNQA